MPLDLLPQASSKTAADPAEEKGDLVGRIVWDFISAASDIAKPGNRMLFMLAGLSAGFLEGIIRKMPDTIHGRSMHVRINPAAAPDLNIPPELLSNETPIYFRGFQGADIVVFAPSDEDREIVGAGLGPVARIDEALIIEQTDLWLRVLDDSGVAEAFTREMLLGLQDSGICIDLQMWVDFIYLLKKQGFSSDAHMRVQLALPALQIPIYGATKLPNYHPSGNPRAKKQVFKSAFLQARNEVGVYAGLDTPKQERVDLIALQEAVESFPVDSEPDAKTALEAVERLIADERNIRPGEWTEAQRYFCEAVRWDSIGSKLFSAKRKAPAKSMWQDTRDYLIGNFGAKFDANEVKKFDKMVEAVGSEPSADEVSFFEKWKDQLNSPESVHIFRAWQKWLFNKEVIGSSLCDTLQEGLEALLIGADTNSSSSIEDPRILVRAFQHEKMAYWKSRDSETLRLFKFELRSMKGCIGDSVVWDLDQCFSTDGEPNATAKDKKKVELAFFLIDKRILDDDISDVRKLGPGTPRIKVIWDPSHGYAGDPITLALPEDISALGNRKDDEPLFKRQNFSPRTQSKKGLETRVTLGSINSFNGASGGQDGRLFDPTKTADEDLLKKVRSVVDELASTGSLSDEDAAALIEALEGFDTASRRALRDLSVDVEAAFRGRCIEAQVEAFGQLCRACRLHARSERAKAEIRPRIAEIGVVVSTGAEPLAILAGWHPLRLAEMKARIEDLSVFVTDALAASLKGRADLTIAFEARRARNQRWISPEIVIADETVMTVVENAGGYSLLSAADCRIRSQEATEASADRASKKFMDAVEAYLDTHPHEASNLSMAIYDAESRELPSRLADRLAQLLQDREDLRCELSITHRDQSRMRSIYRSQNQILTQDEPTDIGEGFLGKLRIDVRSNAAAETDQSSIKETDIVCLHDSISRLANLEWELETGSSEEMGSSYDLAVMDLPRKKISEVQAPGATLYLTLPEGPRPLLQFYDLLYEIGTKAVLPENRHGVLLRTVKFDDPRLKDIVQRSHDLGEWVVCHDTVSSRAILEKCGIKIILDATAPGLGERITISSGGLDARLRANVRKDLVGLGVQSECVGPLSESVLEDVLQVSGQKILSAARVPNASKEMIGLSVMRHLMEGQHSSENRRTSSPIWISLDDYRGWFTAQKGKVADAVGLTIIDADREFEILFHVGEAKLVTAASEQAEKQDACRQVWQTVARIRSLFIDNGDGVSRVAWCRRLADLLVNRDQLATRIPSQVRRRALLRDLAMGKVKFRVSGEAIICLHDYHGEPIRSTVDEESPYLRSHVLSSGTIKNVLLAAAGQKTSIEFPSSGNWYPGDESADEQAHDPTPIQDRGEGSLGPTNEQPSPSGASSRDGEDNTRTAAPTEVEEEHDRESAPETAQAVIQAIEAEEAISGEPGRTMIGSPAFHRILERIAATETRSVSDEKSIKWAEAISEDTQRALSHFGMQAHFVEPKFRLTPNGVLISFKGHHTLTVEKIEKKLGELLTTYGIDAIDVRPGKGKISIFIQRENRAEVPLAKTWLAAEWPDGSSEVRTSFLLGAREDDDRLLYLNLAGEFAGYDEHGPHTLIGGETKSGKGVLVQNLLLQIIAFNDPRYAELILVDPKKGVDFGWLSGTPHMRESIIVDPEVAADKMRSMVELMDHRYDLLSKVGAQNIDQYNAKVGKSERLSRIFLVHDELGAWMADLKEYREVVLSSVSNLGMKARAAGIHLILITQRADADAVPPKLRDNMGNRLCLKVQNATGSRMVLNEAGAEKLLGRGHMACVLNNQAPPSGQKFFIVQVPFAKIEAINDLAKAAIDYWRSRIPASAQISTLEAVT
ncbi:FtsK/SpoIIIE domain-containing protein [Jiella sp. M17.18]|uniref:FtsK/SpoIIIE domain-containing protein n=1 Tax=Jiella sp. M17.18 TaxID=3234247 RepID=UPI0034DF8A65